MSRPKFELSSFKYENISTRMERLKQSQNHSSSTSNLRSASVDPKSDNKYLHKNASSTLLMNANSNNINLLNLLQEDSGLDITSKYSGRVAKNTGIRKYNQRMLREVGNINRKTPPKYTTTTETVNINQSVNNSLNPTYLTETSQNYLRTKSPVRVQSSSNEFISRSGNYDVDESIIDRNRFTRNIGQSALPKYGQERVRLEPGKIYTREELEVYFGC